MAKDGTTTRTAINPLVGAWSGPYGGVPPWDQVRPDRISDGFETVLAEERAEIEAIASSAEPPTFENTVEALERSGLARST